MRSKPFVFCTVITVSYLSGSVLVFPAFKVEADIVKRKQICPFIALWTKMHASLNETVKFDLVNLSG